MSHLLIRDTPDYCLSADQYDNGFVLVHFEVRRWAPSVYRTMNDEWRLFRTAVTCPLFTTGGATPDAKWRKFITRFGFVPHSTVITNNGESRTLYWNYDGHEHL